MVQPKFLPHFFACQATSRIFKSGLGKVTIFQFIDMVFDELTDIKRFGSSGCFCQMIQPVFQFLIQT